MSSNTETPTRSEIPAWARERAEMLQGLYIHLLVFVLMNAGLFFINWATRPDDGSWWFLWVLVVWGIGLLIHVAVTVTPVFRSDWVEKRAERIASQH
jgi:hypothetical protein